MKTRGVMTINPDFSSRRRLLSALALLPAVPRIVKAADEPPLRVVVPFSPGGATDVMARAIAELMEKSSGRSVVVENKPGGATVIAARDVMNAAPDGNTVLFANAATLTQLPNLRQDLPYDPFKDFSYITEICRVPQPLLATAELPVKSLHELIEYAKANPGAV